MTPRQRVLLFDTTVLVAAVWIVRHVLSNHSRPVVSQICGAEPGTDSAAGEDSEDH